MLTKGGASDIVVERRMLFVGHRYGKRVRRKKE